jgi:hypothetical protein
MQLIALWPDRALAIPDDAYAQRLVEKVSAVAAERVRRLKTNPAHDVLKLLLKRWLLSEGPIKMKDLQQQCGASQPTVANALRHWGKLIERTSDRAVAITNFPRDAWSEILALAPRSRGTTGYADRSGRTNDLGRLVERMKRTKPRLTRVAAGGVLAAKRWDPEFDLHGIPRIDLTVHAPRGELDLAFIRRLDPALAPTEDPRSGIIVVHALTRAEPLFDRVEPKELQFADPVEVLLDLHELRLGAQADALIKRLRSGR